VRCGGLSLLLSAIGGSIRSIVSKESPCTLEVLAVLTTPACSNDATACSAIAAALIAVSADFSACCTSDGVDFLASLGTAACCGSGNGFGTVFGDGPLTGAPTKGGSGWLALPYRWVREAVSGAPRR